MVIFNVNDVGFIGATDNSIQTYHMRPQTIASVIDEDISLNSGLLFEDEIEFIEPMGFFTYAGYDYPFWGNVAGRTKTADYEKGKFNRYAKLGNMADQIVQKLIQKVRNDTSSLDGRCAYASLLMMKYGVRIGNEDSAEGYVSGMKQNKGEMVQTFGTTTLQNNHISFVNNQIRLHFLGKEQVEHHMTVSEPFFIKYGKTYFESSLPHEKWLGIDYDLLFHFVRTELGEGFAPKDLRTFCANVTAWKHIQSYLDKPKKTKKSEAKKEIKAVVEATAKRLGNTPGIAKRNYIDGRMLDWFLAQRFEEES